MENTIKMNGGKGPGLRQALMSPAVALYYLFSGTGVVLGWLMAAGVVIGVIAEIVAGGSAMVAAFLLGRQAGFVVGLFLAGLLLWALVMPTLMLARELFVGMKTITKYYVKSGKKVQTRLFFGKAAAESESK